MLSARFRKVSALTASVLLGIGSGLYQAQAVCYQQSNCAETQCIEEDGYRCAPIDNRAALSQVPADAGYANGVNLTCAQRLDWDPDTQACDLPAGPCGAKIPDLTCNNAGGGIGGGGDLGGSG